VPYSALQREHEHVIHHASEAGAGIIVRGGVARGAPTDWSGRQYYMVSRDTLQDRWERAGLDELLDADMTRMEFMLRFTLSHPDLDTTIVGTKSVEHLHDNVAAALNGPLPEDMMTEARRRLDAAGSVPKQAGLSGGG
jgi:aryl-alcohol dehydrogenase-like predicted oxidoreductase